MSDLVAGWSTETLIYQTHPLPYGVEVVQQRIRNVGSKQALFQWLSEEQTPEQRGLHVVWRLERIVKMV